MCLDLCVAQALSGGYPVDCCCLVMDLSISFHQRHIFGLSQVSNFPELIAGVAGQRCPGGSSWMARAKEVQDQIQAILEG